jgi:hypothetical protein
VGYLPCDRAAANMVFQLISRRYERGSIILTSNKTFSEWGQVFTDEVIATAILDRLLHHVRRPRSCVMIAPGSTTRQVVHRPNHSPSRTARDTGLSPTRTRDPWL